MSTDLGVVIASSALSGSFALLGVALTNGVATRRERTAFRTETALELAGMETLVWGDNWIELQAYLQRQQARMAVAGVPEPLISAFHDISQAAWRDVYLSREQSGGEHEGMRTSLLRAREKVHRAVRAELLREGTRTERAQLVANAIGEAAAAGASSDAN